MIKSKLLNIEGRVQGVGFRYFAYHLAKELSLYGWVKNIYDGTVKINVIGDEIIIDSFIEKLKTGNGFSRVDRMDITEYPNLNLKIFEIRY
jgi:acylphosphatase